MFLLTRLQQIWRRHNFLLDKVAGQYFVPVTPFLLATKCRSVCVSLIYLTTFSVSYIFMVSQRKIGILECNNGTFWWGLLDFRLPFYPKAETGYKIDLLWILSTAEVWHISHCNWKIQKNIYPTNSVVFTFLRDVYNKWTHNCEVISLRYFECFILKITEINILQNW
jgi:hypothetical protein